MYKTRWGMHSDERKVTLVSHQVTIWLLVFLAGYLRGMVRVVRGEAVFTRIYCLCHCTWNMKMTPNEGIFSNYLLCDNKNSSWLLTLSHVTSHQHYFSRDTNQYIVFLLPYISVINNVRNTDYAAQSYICCYSSRSRHVIYCECIRKVTNKRWHTIPLSCQICWISE